MRNQDNRLLWFLGSFVPCFGAFIALHLAERGDAWGGVVELFYALVSIPVLVIAWAISRKANRPLAQGFIWSLAANFIFLFTLGGCGILQISGR